MLAGVTLRLSEPTREAAAAWEWASVDRSPACYRLPPGPVPSSPGLAVCREFTGLVSCLPCKEPGLPAQGRLAVPSAFLLPRGSHGR